MMELVLVGLILVGCIPLAITIWQEYRARH